MPIDDLFVRWMKSQETRTYWEQHGKTKGGIPIKLLNLDNAWTAKVIGPYPSPERSDYDTLKDYRWAKKYHKPFRADMEYYYIIPYWVWCTKQFEGMTLEEVEAKCREYASDQKNIYDPDRSLVNGIWCDRKDIAAARQRYKAELDAQFEKERQEYFQENGLREN